MNGQWSAKDEALLNELASRKAMVCRSIAAPVFKFFNDRKGMSPDALALAVMNHAQSLTGMLAPFAACNPEANVLLTEVITQAAPDVQ